MKDDAGGAPGRAPPPPPPPPVPAKTPAKAVAKMPAPALPPAPPPAQRGDVAAAKGGELKEAIQMLATDPSDRDQCLARCAVIEAATLKRSSCHGKVLALGGPAGLVGAMRAHPKDEEVQAVAARALQHLASATTLQGASKVAEAGACAVVTAAMDRFPNHALVQQVACGVLELVAFGGVEPRARAIKEGAVEAVTKALKAHRTSANIQLAALAALQAFASGDEVLDCGKRFSDTGGVHGLIASLGDHKEDAWVQYWGNCFIRSLGAKNPELRTEIQRQCHWKNITLDLED